MLSLLEIGTVFALIGGTVFYFLLLFLSHREKVAGNRELQRRIEEQAAQIQAMETRLHYVETALCAPADAGRFMPSSLQEASKAQNVRNLESRENAESR